MGAAGPGGTMRAYEEEFLISFISPSVNIVNIILQETPEATKS